MGQGGDPGTSNFDTKGAENACAQGMLPMMTWESWDTTNISQTDPVNGVAYQQPKFSLYNINHGMFDPYIKAMADAIKALPCPIAIRLDQEQNGYWYPWGLTTKWTTNASINQATPARYKTMWRHIWKIFHTEGATNVLWVWSPNFQAPPKAGSPNKLSLSYPGNKYVDWVGLDGYYYNQPTMTFAKLFNPTIAQIRPFAATKPWIVAETGVGGTSLTPAMMAAQVTNLLHAVAIRTPFNGLVYFNQSDVNNDRADWLIDQSPAMLNAFKTGINKPVYSAGIPGSM